MVKILAFSGRVQQCASTLSFNEALHVIGLHGAGDKISLCLQDWEMAKVASSCRMALDILCQEMYDVGKGTWLVRVLSASCVTEGEGSE